VNRYATAIKWLSVVLILVSVLLIFRHLPAGQVVQALQGWIDRLGLWGPVLFGLLYVVAVVLLVPASVLTLAAGALFGLVAGTVVVSLAATTGAALAFLISRHLARDLVARKVAQNPKYAAIDRAISASGWKIVALLRLSPAVPFNLQNYLYGLTGIPFWTCVLTSWLAMLPGTFLYVYLGYAGRAGLEAAGGEAGARSRTPGEWALTAVGLLATVVVTVYVTRLAHQAVKQRTALAGEGEAGQPGPEQPPGPKGWPWSTTVTALVALGALAAAGFLQLHPDLLPRLFGLPRQ
jgi:uncharacterized membrane protein YdjX (TVP38/TMEM64 family)